MQIIKKIFSRLIFTAIIIYAGNSLAEDAWSSHYSFSNYGQKGTQLIQADLIKKGESDYYDNIGKTYIGELNTYYQEGNFNNINSTENSSIDITNYNSKTTTIGSQNNSSTSITNSGSGNIDVINSSYSSGSQNGSIDIN